MKYSVKVNGEEFEVEVDPVYGGTVRSGISLYEPAPQPSTIAASKPVAPVAAKPASTLKPIAAAPKPIATAPKPVATSSKPVAASSGESSTITSPMPGNVFKIVAPAGTAVKAGQTVIVIEAMKMEIDVAATKDGVVDQILVKEGQTLNTGDAVATIK